MKPVTITLPPALLAQVDAYAARHHRSRSNAAQVLLSAALAAEEPEPREPERRPA